MEERQTSETPKGPGLPDFGEIVLIDDNTIDLFVAERELKSRLGEVEIHTFQNAPEALGMLRKIRKPGKFPCLIIVDMKMPGMDGATFLKKLQKLKRFNPEKCCVMLLSAYFNYNEGYEIRQLTRDYPFVSRCLEKPFRAAMLPGGAAGERNWENN